MSIGEKIVQTTEFEPERKLQKTDKPSKQAVSIFKQKAFVSYGPTPLEVK